MLNKRGATFGTVIAVLGSILIALGFAWLIAKNWNVMPALVKLIILVIITIAAYVGGVLFKVHNYEGIGKSLIVLGALLFTLTIMLLAQIFNLKVGLQGYANLLLISFIGVAFASYIFDSRASLVVAVLEFGFWISFQYNALIANRFVEYSMGTSLLLYLIFGIFFYGLNLLHRSFEHKFARTYQFWSIFYLLGFAYLLSFQMLIPLLWPFGISLAQGSLFFVLGWALIAVVLFVLSSASAIGRKAVDMKEIALFVLVIVLFLVMIFSAGVITSGAGTCYQKSCYDFNTQEGCMKIADSGKLACSWNNNYCRQLDCYSYENKTACLNAPASLNCYWQNNSQSPSSGMVVVPDGNCYNNYSLLVDNQANECTEFNNKREECMSQEMCRWQPGLSYYSSFRGGRAKVPLNIMLFWIMNNIIFLLVIIAAVGYGYWYKNSKIINLGIMAFILDVITRYIGFIIDYWGSGYNILALLFIIGGIILLAGGWFVEKLRRKLIKDIKQID